MHAHQLRGCRSGIWIGGTIFHLETTVWSLMYGSSIRPILNISGTIDMRVVKLEVVASIGWLQVQEVQFLTIGDVVTSPICY